MLAALLILLREGIEAALVIGLTLSYLEKAGRPELRRAVWTGLGLAVAGSALAAWLLQRLPLNAEAVEGTLMLVAAVFVGTTLLWMRRHAKELSGDIRRRVDSAAAGGGGGAFALGAFVFFMVLREGAEAVLFLSALTVSGGGLVSLAGAALGLGLAIVLAIAFFKRALQLDVKRFFFATNFILAVLVVQLLIHAYHEYSEVGWVPATQATMAIVGPVVKNSVLFVVALLALPAVLVLAPAKGAEDAKHAKPSPAETGPEARRARAALGARRTWTAAFLGLAALVGGLLLWDHVRSSADQVRPHAEPIAMEGGAVRIPLASLPADTQRHFVTSVGGADVRFFVYVVDGRDPKVALDACEICGPRGYRQEGRQLICINCGAEIHPPSLGQSGGCNPIPVTFTVADGAVTVTESALAAAQGG